MENVNDSPFIAVEGPIGVGKTSLATKLADYYQYHLLKEIVDENPFLSKFYEDIDEWSFQTEMFFLCNRFKQLEDTYERFLTKGHPVVSDYHIFKNHLFAKQTLQQHHFDKYDRIYNILTDGLPTPNVIIYLHASLDTLMSRIKMRGRAMEQSIDPDYLQRLANDYHQFMKDHQRVYPNVPIITINGDELDFIQREEDFTRIADQIDGILNQKQTLF
ncbi:deoxynucleoside kinase [Salisediminibacterium halotolerans]|uniref:Deoxyguanosine kinase n=1 Tax=Salisediminibacterium halotolerans TaxID=517425 RepID=A0A1H9NXI8_9BACI|nr:MULTISPECIES: deoxynucleoside kinase [Salisediminibacterium]RLJ77879.1 deoxyguanosine kinase [Actinophytocola xinjiangensis]RPE88783.1 deoxyguanosine kinase [Salisediminibacterium halotolerans]TWG36856.1 deoxyguanosine kinase [Salisediminibacterium halotolerans]SER40375.1 deoxyguanosine kinase [Salisediminibacterium haloalkalitolerans]GEL08412.1 deoxyguanosine kinase [Salisediminibacterium halotolerans]